MASMRVFVAIALSDEILAALGRVAAQLGQGPGGGAGRWVRPEGIHLTLKFLGEVPTELIEPINATIEKVCRAHVPFSLRLAGLGCFPNARRPRVVWAGVEEETGRLERLQAAVDRELARDGFPREARGFTPHLTLARVRDGATRDESETLGRAVAAYTVGETPSMTVRAVHVIKSDLRPSGAVYTPLYEAPLAEGCT
jgi:2'-5' RNA ligase